MTQQSSATARMSLFSIPVIVAALGYFVDIYDLLLFTQIRIPSLRELGLNDAEISTVGTSILNYQMVGLLLGGILWGILGDKKGRLSVLFGSILLYSLANIANGMVQTVPQYSLCRFIAGIGLAGELGAGITLVSELLSKEQRGIATSMVAGIGLTGAVAAYFIKQYFDWRVCFYIGGGLGLMLLFLSASSTAPVYLYLFTWQSPVLDGVYKALHCMEIPFVMNNIARCEEMTGGGKDAYVLADKASQAWINFARSGDPNHKGLPTWPKYNASVGATMMLDNTCVVRNHPDKEVLELVATAQPDL